MRKILEKPVALTLFSAAALLFVGALIMGGLIFLVDDSNEGSGQDTVAATIEGDTATYESKHGFKVSFPASWDLLNEDFENQNPGSFTQTSIFRMSVDDANNITVRVEPEMRSLDEVVESELSRFSKSEVETTTDLQEYDIADGATHLDVRNQFTQVHNAVYIKSGDRLYTFILRGDVALTDQLLAVVGSFEVE